MAIIEFRLADPQPPGSPLTNLRHAKVVVRGSGEDSRTPGQDPSAAAVYSPGSIRDDLVSHGIVISRVPYQMPDEETLRRSNFNIKEELARFVEKGIITVTLIGTGLLTANAIRTF